MMIDLGVAVVIVVASVAISVYVIYRWGPGTVRSRVHCPEKKVRASVKVVRKEGAIWGQIVNDDIVACSLLPRGPVDCEKKCLS